jgi:hypothetical protein
MTGIQRFNGRIGRNFHVSGILETSKELFPLGFLAFGAVRCGGFGDMRPTFTFRGLDDDTHAGVEDTRDPAQHAQRVTFVSRRFESTDLLLGSFEQLREIFLGESGLFA